MRGGRRVIINNPGVNTSDMVTTKQISVIEWDQPFWVAWAKEYAAKFVGLMVTDENLKDMEDAKKELSSKKRRLDEFRKQEKAKMEGPIKKFEAEVKEVIDIISAVELPIAEQVRKFEDQRRCEQATEVSGWIQDAVKAAGLRANFAAQLSIAESWTNRTAVKSKVKAEIEAKVTALMQLQAAEDQAAEMKRQRDEMAVMMCRMQSESMGLASPVTPADIYGIQNLSLSDLPAAITTAVTRRKESETAAIERAERQKVEAAEREAKRLQDAEAARIRQAEIDAAKEAIARVEAQTEAVKQTEELPFAPLPEPQYKMTIRYFGTKAECDWLLNMLEGNGIDVLDEGRVRIS